MRARLPWIAGAWPGPGRARHARCGRPGHRFARRAGTGVCGRAFWRAFGDDRASRPPVTPGFGRRATRAGRCRGRAAPALRRSTGAASEDCIRDRRAALLRPVSLHALTTAQEVVESGMASAAAPPARRRTCAPGDAVRPMSDWVGISRAARPTRRRVAPGAASTNDVAQRGSSVFHVEHRSADSLLVSRETPGAAPAGCAPPRVAQRPAGPARRHVEVDVVNPAPHPPSDDVSRETPDAHQPPGAAGRTG
jgi:hypothetical protein